MSVNGLATKEGCAPAEGDPPQNVPQTPMVAKHSPSMLADGAELDLSEWFRCLPDCADPVDNCIHEHGRTAKLRGQSRMGYFVAHLFFAFIRVGNTVAHPTTHGQPHGDTSHCGGGSRTAPTTHGKNAGHKTVWGGLQTRPRARVGSSPKDLTQLYRGQSHGGRTHESPLQRTGNRAALSSDSKGPPGQKTAALLAFLLS